MENQRKSPHHWRYGLNKIISSSLFQDDHSSGCLESACLQRVNYPEFLTGYLKSAAGKSRLNRNENSMLI